MLDWIFQRLDGKENTAVQTPIGYIPNKDSFNTDGLPEKVDFDQLFSIDKKFWKQEVILKVILIIINYSITGIRQEPFKHVLSLFGLQIEEVTTYLDEQVGSDLPHDIVNEAEALKKRIEDW